MYLCKYATLVVASDIIFIYIIKPYYYRVHLEKHIVPYTLRLHALPVPAVAHVYAESSLVYKLVVMKNRIAVSDKVILKRLDDQNFSLIGFNHLVINGILSNYSYTCTLQICYTCGGI